MKRFSAAAGTPAGGSAVSDAMWKTVEGATDDGEDAAMIYEMRKGDVE